MEWIVTGASRGIGRALARTLVASAQRGDRFHLLARDVSPIAALAPIARSRGVEVTPMHVDLARVDDARRAGEQLADHIRRATLIHNAGVWPTERVLVDGLEASFVVNCLAPLVLQAPLLAGHRLERVLVISAGLLVQGRFDPGRTPAGRDFSALRTYADTKLAGAAAMRAEARRHPAVDFAIVHPGVVRTDLGAMRGPVGWLMNLVKRRWESPEACAERLRHLLERPRWSHVPGEATWFVEDREAQWPDIVDRVQEDVGRVIASHRREPRRH